MTNFRSRSTYVRFSLESLNRTVANLVDGNKEIAKKIHRQLKEVCEEHVKVQLNKLENVNSSDNEHFLLLLDRIWQEHCKAFSLIINLFLKLDRHGYFSFNELGSNSSEMFFILILRGEILKIEQFDKYQTEIVIRIT